MQRLAPIRTLSRLAAAVAILTMGLLLPPGTRTAAAVGIEKPYNVVAYSNAPWIVTIVWTHSGDGVYYLQIDYRCQGRTYLAAYTPDMRPFVLLLFALWSLTTQAASPGGPSCVYRRRRYAHIARRQPATGSDLPRSTHRRTGSPTASALSNTWPS